MALRLTDTEKWKKPWFLDLPVEYKALWNYLCDECNHAGIWEVNFKLANFLIGYKFDENKAAGILEKQIIVLDGGRRWFLVDFIEWQYKCSIENLNPSNRAHFSVIQILEKYGIPVLLKERLLKKEEKEGAIKPLNRPLLGCKDKDKDKDKDLKEGGYRGEKKRRPDDMNQIIEYFRELNIQQPEMYAEKFFNFYEANGWVQGKGRKPIKDWKSCAKTWDLPRAPGENEKTVMVKIIGAEGQTSMGMYPESWVNSKLKDKSIERDGELLVMDQRNKASPDPSPEEIKEKIKLSINA